MADAGLIVTVVIFCLIFAWIITFSILACVLKKPLFSKLSIIGPLGYKIYTCANGMNKGALSNVYHQAKADRYAAKAAAASSMAKQQGGYYDYDYSYNDIDPDF